MLKADLEAVGLPTIDENGSPLVFHSFRHTATTWLLEAGVPEVSVMANTGHKTRSMLDRYGHRRRAAAKEAIKALPQLMRATGTDGSACALLAHERSEGVHAGPVVAVDTPAGAINNAIPLRRSGGTGRRAGLKIRWG